MTPGSCLLRFATAVHFWGKSSVIGWGYAKRIDSPSVQRSWYVFAPFAASVRGRTLLVLRACLTLATLRSREFHQVATTADLRQAKRYRLRAPVKFSWKRPDGDILRDRGFTRDISPCGAFVVSANAVPSGSQITVEVTLPTLRTRSHTGPCLRTLGHVVRSEPHGFAVTADFGFRMQFSDNDSLQEPVNANENGGTKDTKQLLVPVSHLST